MKRLTAIPLILAFSLITPLHAAEPASSPSSATIPQSAPPPLKQVLIGVVDILRIGTESKVGKAEKKRFEARGEKLKGEIEARGKKLEKEKKALEEKLPSLPPDQRQARIKEFEKKLDSYRKMVEKAQAEMEPLQKEINDRIFSLVEKGAAKVAAEKGLSVVIPKRDILFRSPDSTLVDVTEEMLEAVDSLAGEK